MTNIKHYEVKFEARDVSPEQREFIYKSLDEAFDKIIKNDLIGLEQYLSIGETRVSERLYKTELYGDGFV